MSGNPVEKLTRVSPDLASCLKVEKFAEEIEGAGHLLEAPQCSVLGDLMINLKRKQTDIAQYDFIVTDADFLAI